jgi:hypothetical protein
VGSPSTKPGLSFFADSHQIVLVLVLVSSPRYFDNEDENDDEDEEPVTHDS